MSRLVHFGSCLLCACSRKSWYCSTVISQLNIQTEASTTNDATSSTLIDFKQVSQTSSLNFFPKISSKGFSSFRLSSITVLSSSHSRVWYLNVTCDNHNNSNARDDRDMASHWLQNFYNIMNKITDRWQTDRAIRIGRPCNSICDLKIIQNCLFLTFLCTCKTWFKLLPHILFARIENNSSTIVNSVVNEYSSNEYSPRYSNVTNIRLVILMFLMFLLNLIWQYSIALRRPMFLIVTKHHQFLLSETRKRFCLMLSSMSASAVTNLKKKISRRHMSGYPNDAKSYKRVNFGSCSCRDLSILAQSILKRFTVVETVT